MNSGGVFGWLADAFFSLAWFVMQYALFVIPAGLAAVFVVVRIGRSIDLRAFGRALRGRRSASTVSIAASGVRNFRPDPVHSRKGRVVTYVGKLGRRVSLPDAEVGDYWSEGDLDPEMAAELAESSRFAEVRERVGMALGGVVSGLCSFGMWTARWSGFAGTVEAWIELAGMVARAHRRGVLAARSRD